MPDNANAPFFDKDLKPDTSGNALVSSDDTVELVYDSIAQSRNTVSTFRREAERMQKMKVGWQWEPDDLALLREQGRPAIVFNRSAAILNVVQGTEINNRQQIVFVPRHPELEPGGALADLATGAVEWAINGTQGDDERSVAFGDTCTVGMGFTESRMSYDEEMDGKFVLERFDYMEAWWDPASRKQNLEDARWVARRRWMHRRDIARMWPDKVDEISMTTIPEVDYADLPNVVEQVTPVGYDPVNETKLPGSPTKNFLPIIQFQWFKYEDYYRVADPDNPDGELLEFSKEDFSTLRERLLKLKKPIPKYVKQKKKVYYETFLAGRTKLSEKKLAVQTGFTLQCITGYWDPKDKIWFGLMRGMEDPQRWANKWLSQGLHIINANAKGGLIAEEDAFTNPRKAEDEWAQTDKITFVRPGGLAKLKEKTIPQFPPAIATMMQYAVTSLREVTGVNIEMLGMAEGDEPGVTTRHRQTQGMTILATLFNALTRYRRVEARMVLEFIREYLADGRLVRIGGDYDAQSIPLLKEPLSVDYDLIIDENPKNPNTKMEVWSTITQLAPALIKFGLFAPELLDYSPLPSSIVAKLKQRMAQSQQQQQQQPPPDQGSKEDPRLTEAKIQKTMADTVLQKERAAALQKEAELQGFEVMFDAKTTQQKMASDHQLQQQKIHSDHATNIMKNKVQGMKHHSDMLKNLHDSTQKMLHPSPMEGAGMPLIE